MLRSAAFRIAIAYSAVFAVATLLLGVTIYFVSHQALQRQLDDRLSAEMSSLISEYRHEGEPALRAIIRQRETARATNDLGYALFRGDGVRMAGSLMAPKPEAGWQSIQFADPVKDGDAARALAVDIAPDRRLVVAADWDTLQDTDLRILSILAIALVSMVLVGTLGAFSLVKYLQSRLAVISRSAGAIIEGNLEQRIPLGSNNDEFDRLSTVLNAMLDRIAALMENLQQVSSDIAHDLRQPLTRLRNQLERGQSDGDPMAALEAAIVQTDQVLTLFGSLLRISEIEAGKLRSDFAPVDLSQLARELGESYSLAIEDDGRSFHQQIANTPLIVGDRELLAQAFINLLDNAQVHTPEGTRILLSVTSTMKWVIVTVADDGPGVPSSDRPRLTGRFTRLEASRHRPGHGLGLSLVAAIARIHGANLVIEDNRPGLSVRIDFPR